MIGRVCIRCASRESGSFGIIRLCDTCVDQNPGDEVFIRGFNLAYDYIASRPRNREAQDAARAALVLFEYGDRIEDYRVAMRILDRVQRAA